MSIFKEHKTIADRSATDRRRHKKKIEKAIKEGIHDIIAEESIIGKDGKKKIKIPIRGIKEYRFIYNDDPGSGQKKVGSAQGKNIKKGQKISSGKKGKRRAQGKKDKASKEKGDEFYEVEISLDELANYLFDDLDLPELEKKNFTNIVHEKYKRKGYRKSGIRPRLSKKETIKNKIKRKKQAIKTKTYDPDSDERFTFHESDLKYKHISVTKKEVTNAVIFFIMDVSGSMGKTKKFLARSFFFLLYQFLRYRYQKVEIVFISHTTEAWEVDEEQFFSRGSSGGTYISSGVERCLEIIKERYDPSNWNIYSFHCSDGDNWGEDNDKALNLTEDLKDLCQLSAYIQILGETSFGMSGGGNRMADIYDQIQDNKFKVARINSKEDVWPQFSKLFGGKYDLDN
jgi:sporulation protein YhbH